MAMATVEPLVDLPESRGYRTKSALLGRPLVSEAAGEEKLTKKAALGVLSSDCISSSAYGSEQMLISLLAVFGLAGFQILMPLTAVVLALLILMTLSYREVVTVYTKAGGSYVVARENFGPRVAQIASVALLIDYVVTVAVQVAAGTAAITSAVPSLDRYALGISVGVVLVLTYGNLRGVREAGKAFAAPTYLFIGAAGSVIVVGLVRALLGKLPVYSTDPNVREGLAPLHDRHLSLLSVLAIFYLAQAFANGGSSLTGLEAISNGVSAFRKPAGRNARTTLSTMSVILGSLVLGISFLAWRTHAAPFADGTPTVISQVAQAAFGTGLFGHVAFIVVQAATALILYTGANTPFTGFPFLASFIAEDSFLPRQLTRRGHRLAFSNGIIVLTVLALALLLAVGSNVNRLVPFYAIGVFTGFTMAGLGMAKYHRLHQEPGWRRRRAINATAGVVSALVVLIFAIVKFTEGAWLVVLLFPLLWFTLVRLNLRYRREARALELATAASGSRPPNYPRHTVVVMVDRLDLAVLRALRYAGSLNPADLRAVHVTTDPSDSAHLQQEWVSHGLSESVPLTLVDCPDRRLIRAAIEMAHGLVVNNRSEVTVLLPRRTYRGIAGRLLHDRTADRIAAAVGKLHHVSATIVPFDTELTPEIEVELDRRVAERAKRPALTDVRRLEPAASPVAALLPRPEYADGAERPIGDIVAKDLVTICGRVKSVQIGSVAGRSLEVEVFDPTGGIRLLFFGRTAIPGLTPGACVRVTGRVGEYRGHLAVANPRYNLLSTGDVG
jgi:amino acid transporter/DNA/RNA endonuclease YhcR with UshA esterase domain